MPRSPFTGAARGIRKATHAHGAGESGLGKLIELHAVNGAGDVMITVALASTVFFSVPTDEARGGSRSTSRSPWPPSPS
ncbi:hypothetical protein SCYAM73S_07656 [Streptomyces cyaneofuscatus]